MIWSLLLSSCEVSPSTLDFHPLVKLGFPLIAQIIHFENKKFLLFESMFVILWLEHLENVDEQSIVTASFLFLTSNSSHIMPCLALGRQSRSVMDHSVSEVSKPLWCITSKEGKKMPTTINPRPGILLLEDKKLLHTQMIDFSTTAFQLLSFKEMRVV